MATPTLDVSFLGYFSPIFIFVLVFTMAYGVFQFTKMFGDNKVLHALISFFIAVVFLFSTAATTVIMVIAPWFTVLFIFIIFILMAYKMFGATDSQIKDVISKASAVQYTILALAIIILLFGLGAGFGQDLLEGASSFSDVRDAATEAGEDSTATNSFQQNLISTLFNTKILGMVLILVIAAFTIRAMTPALKKDWPYEGDGGSGDH
jgi:hypothetical protein